MAGYKDPVVAEVKRIRRKLAERLIRARRKGRVREELKAMEKRAHQALREAAQRAKARGKRAQT